MSETISAREASMSRVQTQETVLKSLDVTPTSQVAATKQDETSPQIPKKTAQERITELAHKRREAENRADEATKRASELEARIRTLEAATPPQIEQSTKPTRSQFTNDELYIEALTDWKAQDAIVKREQQQAEARMKAEMEEIDAAYDKRVADAQKRYPDFNEVVGAATTNIPGFVVMALKESSLGADLVYYLSMHKDEAEKLAAMRPTKATKYLIQLESELESDDATEEPATKETEPDKAAVTPTKKPPAPISPLSGTPAENPGTPRSFEEYRAKRLAAKKGGR